MRVIIAGGGTGGHLFPGLAIAEELKKRNEMTEVIFVGTEHGIEARVVPKEGYPIKFLRAEGMMGVSLHKKITAMAKMFLSFLDSYKIIKLVMPDMLIGVGGYASGAIMLIAALMSIPTVILEQNCIPGFTNRVLGKFANAICITYQESIPFFPKEKTFLTGNPVRMHVLGGSRESGYRFFSLEENLFTVFVFGGSALHGDAEEDEPARRRRTVSRVSTEGQGPSVREAAAKLERVFPTDTATISATVGSSAASGQAATC